MFFREQRLGREFKSSAKLHALNGQGKVATIELVGIEQIYGAKMPTSICE
jgi:hypothetical protein